jgi:hypothetical protein
MQIHMISHPIGSTPAEYDLNDYINELDWGELPLPERTVLVETLRPHTNTPEKCWFCIWDGWGGLNFDGVSEHVHLPNRNYVLYAGPIETAFATLDTGPAEFASEPTKQPWDTQSPNRWWPEDRAWRSVRSASIPSVTRSGSIRSSDPPTYVQAKSVSVATNMGPMPFIPSK